MRIVEAVNITTNLDPLFSLKGLADYASISRRTLQNLVNDTRDPLPSYRIGSKILVRKSEFDAWRAQRASRELHAGTLLAQADAAGLQSVRQNRELHLMEMIRRRDKRRVVAKNQREALFDTLGRRCAECGATDRLTFDHIRPWSHGGKTELANLRVLCRRCNSKRGNQADPGREFPGTVMGTVGCNLA